MKGRFPLSTFANDYITTMAEANGVERNEFVEMMVASHLLLALREMDEKNRIAGLSPDEERLYQLLDDFDERLSDELAKDDHGTVKLSYEVKEEEPESFVPSGPREPQLMVWRNGLTNRL